ncbi:mannitol dehydrogenase family protein [Lichenifustis flavocetrariae]|uniref:Mannitol dehydrogenase family protein n=1 Tax=Lichenifustis flavocetrariae TaxID=2949735 RepID=A0AA41Z2X2_9HYPH|nr:mannitol dehydrogenase family protein [Lichenifustis flavocetrariae]MCW6509370.1 mannitol dehydrogenase family protein [Lichenifustis flavocetrariae]
MHARLSTETLPDLPPSVVRPSYDRAAVKTGIVHLGIGAFHRAHQAVYTDAALGAGDTRWGILGASLRSSDTRDALSPQDGLYTVSVRDGAGERVQVVGSVGKVLVAPEDPEALLQALVRPETHIVSLTVTEKGYCHDPASGELDESHPDVRHDLAHPDKPRSALGFIAEALNRRRLAGATPFTLLSCDNLPANGATLHRIITRFASRRDVDLGRFVADTVHCPSSMVDRIVPATTEADRASVAAAIGLQDSWPIVTEPFSQWVVEDDFGAGRPAWDEAGATFVRDVAPFELMKLRLLNGSHSTLAYLGYLAGHETVAEAMAAPGYTSLIRRMMDEEITTEVPPLAGFDLDGYKASLIARFQNPALRHRTWQIAMDGSQKLPQRLLGTIRGRIVRGAPFERLALGVAAWLRYVTGVDDKGAPIDVRDPLAADLKRRTAGMIEAGALVESVIGVESVFGRDLPREPIFRSTVERALSLLLAEGAAATVARLARQ